MSYFLCLFVLSQSDLS